MIGPRLASATFADSRGPIELRVEDRLQLLAIPIRDMSAAMIAILVGSIVIHGLLVTAALITGRVPPPVVPREISVEIVQDTPRPPAAKPPAPAPQQSPAVASKPEPTKLALPKAEPPKPTPPVADTKPTTASQPPKVAAPPPPKAAPPDEAKAADEAKALEAELANLRAEQAALKADSRETAESTGAGQALAMPSIGVDGDAVGYQQLVFSQLAKAKGDSEYHGKSGVAGIRFEMDRAGQLVQAEVVTPSGDASLDAKALDIVHRAAPFPPPPTDADRIVFANVNFIAPKPQ